MSVIVVGLDRRSARSETLDRVAFSGARIEEVLDGLVKNDDIAEAVVLATCMRTELYVDAIRFHPALEHILETLAEASDLPLSTIADEVFELHDDEAYAHLFKVAAGLDSAVLGESEVLGQVARAWETSRHHGSCRSVLGALFRHAVGVGKRARNETAIARGITSIGQAAVVMAGERLNGMIGRRTLIVGAGEMGSNMAATVSRVEGIGLIQIANRTRARADQLASEIGGRSIEWAHVDTALVDVDLLLMSTGAPESVIDRRRLEPIMQRRLGRPLVIVDVAVPRDVELDVTELEGVVRLDLDDLRVFTSRGRAGREREAEAVEAIVADEVVAYCADASSRLVAPVVTAMRELAESIRTSEIERYAGKMHDFDAAQRELVNAITKSTVSKLLHGPTIRLKDAAGTPQGERMAEALRVLFDV